MQTFWVHDFPTTFESFSTSHQMGWHMVSRTTLLLVVSCFSERWQKSPKRTRRRRKKGQKFIFVVAWPQKTHLPWRNVMMVMMTKIPVGFNETCGCLLLNKFGDFGLCIFFTVKPKKHTLKMWVMCWCHAIFSLDCKVYRFYMILLVREMVTHRIHVWYSYLHLP